MRRALPAVLSFLILAVPAAARQLAAGEMSGIQQAQTVVAVDQAQWEALWARHAAGRAMPRPAVDFAREQVVGIFLGAAPTGGWGVDVRATEGPEGLLVEYAPVPPQPHALVSLVVTHPFRFEALPAEARLVLAPREAAAPVASDAPAASRDSTAASLAAGRKKLGGFFSGEWYASWGYNTETWAPTDIRVVQPGKGNDFTLHGVKAHDEHEWEKDVVGRNLMVPQYSIRLGRFLDNKRNTAVELGFDHTKYTSTVPQQARVTGILDGKPVDRTMLLDDQSFRYNLHNGANHLMLSVVERLPLIGKAGGSMSLAAIAKAGVGVMLPHPDNTVLGQTSDDAVGPKTFGNALGVHRGWWEVDGWTAGVEGGLRYTPAGPFFVEAADKVAYARLNGVPVAGGSAGHSLLMNELIFSVGATINGRKTPAFDNLPSMADAKPSVRVYFGPMRTQYFPTDIEIHTSRINGTLSGVRPIERTSLEYYDILHQPNPFQALDEPSNQLIVSYEDPRRGWAASLKESHYKMLIADGDARARMSGWVDDRWVDQDVRLGDYFSSYKLTTGFIDLEAVVEKMITLARGPAGTLTYAPGIGAGVELGYGDVDFKPPWQDGDPQTSPARESLIGRNLALSNRLIYTGPHDRLSVSLNHELSLGTLRYPMLDGYATQGFNTQTVSLQAGLRLYPLKNRPAPVAP